jgi:hypothetical protein
MDVADTRFGVCLVGYAGRFLSDTGKLSKENIITGGLSHLSP